MSASRGRSLVPCRGMATIRVQSRHVAGLDRPHAISVGPTLKSQHAREDVISGISCVHLPVPRSDPSAPRGDLAGFLWHPRHTDWFFTPERVNKDRQPRVGGRNVHISRCDASKRANGPFLHESLSYPSQARISALVLGDGVRAVPVVRAHLTDAPLGAAGIPGMLKRSKDTPHPHTPPPLSPSSFPSHERARTASLPRPTPHPSPATPPHSSIIPADTSLPITPAT